MHCSRESASQVGELSTTFSFYPFTVMVGSLYGLPGAAGADPGFLEGGGGSNPGSN